MILLHFGTLSQLRHTRDINNDSASLRYMHTRDINNDSASLRYIITAAAHSRHKQ